jgi:hypothetical protein
MVILSFSGGISGYVLEIVHDHLLPIPCLFIINELSTNISLRSRSRSVRIIHSKETSLSRHPCFFNTLMSLVYPTYKFIVLLWSMCKVSIYYLSMALRPFIWLWSLFQFLNLYTVGRTTWTGVSPSQGHYLHTGEHKHRINANRHPSLKWNSNPRSQCLSGRRQYIRFLLLKFYGKVGGSVFWYSYLTKIMQKYASSDKYSDWCIYRTLKKLMSGCGLYHPITIERNSCQTVVGIHLSSGCNSVYWCNILCVYKWEVKNFLTQDGKTLSSGKRSCKWW